MQLIPAPDEEAAEGAIKPDDDVYPIVRLEKYQRADACQVESVAAGRLIITEYALVLRAVFAPEGETTGPFRDIYFKILPAGSCRVSGALLGFPVLDAWALTMPPSSP